MEYDYVIIGAGTAGSIVASRLSEDPSVRVLLVEAGGSDRTPIIAMPAALPFAYESRKLGWGYQSGPEPNLSGRMIDEKRGRVMGGSSSINAMIYNRGNPLDFEGWAADGLPDWSYSRCLPYFRRMETFSGGEDAWRGGSGPMFISRCEAKHKLYDCFLRAGQQAGFAPTKDHNGYRQEGIHVAQAFIHDGLRWSSARGYLRPAAKRENLEIWTGAFVRRIRIDKGVAIGVEITHKSAEKTVMPSREVVLCAGAFNTPQLLMLSGVGDADALGSLGIDVKANVPEVGRNLANHPGVNIQYEASFSDSLVSELGLWGRARLSAEWLLRGKGLGATNFFEAGAFLRSRPDVPYANVQFEFLPLVRFLKNGKLVAAPGFQFWMDLSRPESRGSVKLRSPDPSVAPSIVFNHLDARQDVRDFVDSIRLARTLAAQPAWDKVRGSEISPGDDVRTDADLEAFVRENLGTSYHPCGTCRMGRDANAVVDSDGRVKSIARLRIVDASIMPRIVTANLSAAVMMMAEKLSDHILGKEPLPIAEAPFYQSLH
jgi:choline dehydrogenase